MNSSSSSRFVRRITAAVGTRAAISFAARSPWPRASSPRRQTSGRSRIAASTAESASATSVQRASGSSARRSPTRVGSRSAAMSTCVRTAGAAALTACADSGDDWSSDYDSGMKVLIADDHRLIVEGVKRALDDAPDFEVVGECNSGSQVLPMVGRTNPDVVLLDLRMPGADGLACLEPHPQAVPRGEGRRPLRLDRRERDPDRAQARRKRLHRQEHQPDRPALRAPPGGRGHRLQRDRRCPIPARAPRAPPGSPSARPRSSPRSPAGSRTRRSARSSGSPSRPSSST